MSQIAAENSFPTHCSLEEYFALAEKSDVRLQYFGKRTFPLRGELVAMAGGTPEHSLVIANVNGAIWGKLRGSKCRYYSTELRFGIRGFPTYVYPDGLVACEELQVDDRDSSGNTILNPQVIIEVLSPTTERDDRGRKFQRYMQAESLQDYVLVSQDQPRVEVLSRNADGTWLIAAYQGLESVAKLPSINVELPLKEVFLNVSFPPEEEAPAA